MIHLAHQLWNDDHGFIISAELVLVGTIVALGMMVGLAEVQCSVTNELHDMARAFDHTNKDGKYGDDDYGDDKLQMSETMPEMKGY